MLIKLILSVTINIFLACNIGFAQEFMTSDNLVGKANFTYYFWDVYEIELYAPNKKIESEFKLKLNYKISIKGEDIANTSIEEISKQECGELGEYDNWLNTMKELFPDVEPGDTLVGHKKKNGTSAFFKNDKLIGEFKSNQLSKCFFDIWLSPKTSKNELRKKLIKGRV